MGIKTDKRSRSPSASKQAIKKTKKINDEKYDMSMKRNFTEKHKVDNTQYKMRPKQRKDLYGKVMYKRDETWGSDSESDNEGSQTRRSPHQFKLKTNVRARDCSWGVTF